MGQVASDHAGDEALKRERFDDVDMDELLRQEDLVNLANCFWTRYHTRWPISVMPYDALVSRVSKELSKRLLTLRDIWKSRSQAQQQKTVHKRTKIAEGLDLVHDEDEEFIEGSRSTQKYLDLLFTTFLAYAIAGCQKLDEAPPMS